MLVISYVPKIKYCFLLHLLFMGSCACVRILWVEDMSRDRKIELNFRAHFVLLPHKQLPSFRELKKTLDYLSQHLTLCFHAAE